MTTRRSTTTSILALTALVALVLSCGPATVPHATALVQTSATPVAEQAAEDARPVTIRFLQYNIRYGSRGLAAVARDIRRTGAQVVLLNEVDDRTRTGGVHQARSLARRLGMTWVYDANHRTARGTGNAVLSRWALGSPTTYELPRPGTTQRRGLLRVTVRHPAVRVQVWSTHLNPGAGTVPQATRVAEVVGEPDCATVVGGDMNDGPGTPVDETLRGPLLDAWRTAGQGPGATNFQGSERIDYLYHLRTEPVRAWRTPMRASDHRGVVGVFRLDPALGC